MVNLKGIFSRLSSAKIAVIGDFMLDTYTVGKAKRISPEAPVAVVNVVSEEHRAGGAGNVVLNILSMGSSVIPIGRIGNDIGGGLLRQFLANEQTSTEGLFVQDGYQTPVKNRIIAENQQMVRIDHERMSPLCETLEAHVINALPHLLDDVEVIAISDYDKGFLSRTLLAAIMEYARSTAKIVIVDPKGIDFSKYSGATLIKPNLSEVYGAANLPRDGALSYAAAKVLEIAETEIVMVTRSEAGISLFYPDGQQRDYPVEIHEVKDVTGAGDTVLAMLACGMASGLKADEIAPLCNIAASIAIERFGCARVSLSDVAARLLKLDKGNKVFDGDHPFALEQILRGQNVVTVDLREIDTMSNTLFQRLAELAAPADSRLAIYLGDIDVSSPFVSILKELQMIDFIIVGKSSNLDAVRFIGSI